MARTLERICIKDWQTLCEDEKTFKIERGKKYITTPDLEDGTCRVFSRYWVYVPVTYFAGEQIFTES